MIFKTLKPFEISLHAYSAKYVVARVFDVETKGAAFLKIQVLKLHVWPSLAFTSGKRAHAERVIRMEWAKEKHYNL